MVSSILRSTKHCRFFLLTLSNLTCLLSLHTRRGLGGDSPEDINSFAVLRVSVAQHNLQVVVKNKTPSGQQAQLNM